MAEPKATAVILSGGGAYGAFEVGVLKALCSGASIVTGREPLEPGIFTGASVGSFNAAAMTMSPGATSISAVKRLEAIWLEQVANQPDNDHGNGVYRVRGNPLQYFDITLGDPARGLRESIADAGHLGRDWLQRVAALAVSPVNLPRRTLGLFDLSAFVSVDPFRRLLEQNLDLDGIRASDRILRIIVTNWLSGEVKIFGKEDMTGEHGRTIVMASSAIPGIFPPVEIGDSMYVDGGVIMNTPLSPAIEAGATELHVVFLDPDVSAIPVGRPTNTLDTFSRMYAIMLATKINEDIATASWINAGLEVLEKARNGATLTAGESRDYVRVAGKLAGTNYSELTIHRYNPVKDLGGLLGMLNFSMATVSGLIEMGYESAVQHDCARSGCLLPRKIGKALHHVEHGGA